MAGKGGDTGDLRRGGASPPAGGAEEASAVDVNEKGERWFVGLAGLKVRPITS